LAELKRLAIASANTWKDAGKPKSGPILSNYNKDKLRYKQAISKERVRERGVFTNQLHDALLRKSSKDFWKSWKSKFPSKVSNTINVDGLVHEIEIVKHIAAHFEQVCTPHNSVRNKELQSQYLVTRGNYLGDSLRDSHMFDVGLLSKLAKEMATGKAAGMDGLTTEHLKNSHPIIFTILCKLFSQCLVIGWVPPAFSVSYTVPVPKGDAGSRSLSASNFRGISINCIFSKLFEMAILSHFSSYFETSDLQFSFKKKLSCSHANCSIRNIVDHYIREQSTVSLCFVDLSKAFDKMNHYALFLKLLKRKLPIQIIDIFVHWFEASLKCVSWGSSLSHFVKLVSGVRQGGVLSPQFFALFINDVIEKLIKLNIGCRMSAVFVSIFVVILFCLSLFHVCFAAVLIYGE